MLSTLLDRADRGDGEFRRLVGVGGGGDDARDRLEALSSATVWRVRTTAAAPSEIDELVAAVIVPSLAKAGFSVGILSGLAVAGRFVGVDDGVALAALDGDRHDLVLEAADCRSPPWRAAQGVDRIIVHVARG